MCSRLPDTAYNGLSSGQKAIENASRVGTFRLHGCYCNTIHIKPNNNTDAKNWSDPDDPTCPILCENG